MRILIVKTSSLGDIIQAFPTLNYLKARYPEATIDWVAETACAELVESHPYVNETIVVDTKRWRKALFSRNTAQEITAVLQRLRREPYDLVFDLQGNAKSALFTFAARSAVKVGFGRRSVPERLNLLATNKRYDPPTDQNIRFDYLSLVRQQLKGPFFEEYTPARLVISDIEKELITEILDNKKLKGKQPTLVCPGSAWPNKQMSEQGLTELLAKFSQTALVFVWGTPEERALCQSLYNKFYENAIVIEKMRLPALQNLMWEAERVICMDSLPLHLAGTTPTQTLSVFGPSSAQKYKPIGPQHVAYQGVCPYGIRFDKRCPKLRTCSTGACIRNCDPIDVYQTLSKR